MRKVFTLFAVFLLPLLASCVAPPPQNYTPLDFGYLTKLRLNVATVSVENEFQPGGPGDVSGLSPVQPAQALAEMAQERVLPAGGTGRAVFIIQNASILEGNGTLTGQLAVRLDVYSGNGTRSGYAEARVVRTRPDPEAGTDELRAALYDLTSKMMSDMNVEFEFQVRRSLGRWLVGTAAPGAAVPAPVQQQSLPPPGSDEIPVTPPPPSGYTVPPGEYAPPSGYTAPPQGYTEPPQGPPQGYAPPPPDYAPRRQPYSGYAPRSYAPGYEQPQPYYGSPPPEYGQPPQGYAPPPSGY